MSATKDAPKDPHQPRLYQIKVAGHLAPQWAHWFEGMSIELEEGGQTLLTGPVVDQAALYGVLNKIRDLGMPLLSVNCIEPYGASEAETSR